MMPAILHAGFVPRSMTAGGETFSNGDATRTRRLARAFPASRFPNSASFAEAPLQRVAQRLGHLVSSPALHRLRLQIVLLELVHERPIRNAQELRGAALQSAG